MRIHVVKWLGAYTKCLDKGEGNSANQRSLIEREHGTRVYTLLNI